jgi:hypothetical protein
LLSFKAPEISDKQWVDELLFNSKIQSCDFCFGNIFIWAKIYNTQIARLGNALICRYFIDNEYSYSFVPGAESIELIVNEMLEDAQKHNQSLKIYGLTKSEKQLLEEKMKDAFQFTEMRDFFDYVYNTEDLINLSGRKYHQKRNHISYFKNNHSWQYETITDDNIEECRAFNRQWERHNGNKSPDELLNENLAIQTALDNFDALSFVGGLLRVDGKIEAYTLGEPLNDEMFCTHIEKANADMRGAYAMINQQFAEHELSSYKFVNREEDTGSEGLRQAKMTYHPAFLVENYFARYIK